MRHFFIPAMILISLARFVWAQPATQATTEPAATPATTQALELMDRKSLLALDRAELGDRFNPADAEAIDHAHLLIEKFFATPGMKDRQAIAKELAATNVDPNLLGRLTRVRATWPKLDGGPYYINEHQGIHEVKYFLGLPKDYDRSRAWPLVIKLPGADAFVTDPPPTGEQVVAIYQNWLEEELKRHPDAIVLMPRLNLDELYGPGYPGMNSVFQPMLHAAGRVNIDPARVYLVGHSMAAHGVWNIALHYPTYFAAINPLAGGAGASWQRLRLMNLRNVLPVVWHDVNDELIKVDSSRALVKILKNQKIDVDYDETNGIGHVPTNDVLELSYGKMRRRVRTLYPQQVSLASNRPDSIFNRIDWVQVYQPLSAGDEQRMFLSKGTGRIIFNTNAIQIDAAITKPNTIEAATKNVGILRFYLNDQMVNFDKAITVVINGKTRFEGFVKPSVEEMLNDQLFLGRGWRYFTGVIDIDLTTPGATTNPTSQPTTTTAPVHP